MNDRKHVVVGLFALGALILLGVLVIWFQGVAGFVRGGYTLYGHLPTSRGVRTGKRVHKDGIEVGDVREVTSSLPEKPGVWIRMRIDPGVRIPKEAKLIAQSSTVGDVFLDFQTGVTPTGYLPTDGSARVDGVPKAPSLLPEDLMADFREGMDSLDDVKLLVENLRQLTQPPPDKQGETVNLWGALEQFQATAKAVQDRVADENLDRLIASARASADELTKTLQDARETMASVRDTAKVYQTTGAKANALLERITERAEEAKTLIGNINGLVADVRGGKGTVGRLVADDELHRSLVTLIENLTAMTDNADRLITMLRERGVFAKEKP